MKLGAVSGLCVGTCVKSCYVFTVLLSHLYQNWPKDTEMSLERVTTYEMDVYHSVILQSRYRFLVLFSEQSERMRLSTIFELLLILLLVAFAAYGRVIDLTTMSLKQATDSVNRYCTCNENICNCCRDFHIPLVQLKGPGNYHAMHARKMKVQYGSKV
ncbi:Replicase polyprotein 1a [Temnothorax longispinosus]|uniref:Replicase polyprotein 1a n=1 Tax=Temnothorax longispinosus TaxID=300112 RepID=A0A4V3SAQ5_9HYME|nr:Replicase polyprotein 1a [Temnothorax longispinosus]